MPINWMSSTKPTHYIRHCDWCDNKFHAKDAVPHTLNPPSMNFCSAKCSKQMASCLAEVPK